MDFIQGAPFELNIATVLISMCSELYYNHD